MITHIRSVRTHEDENIQIISERTVQETTFYSAIQADGHAPFMNVRSWLHAFFNQASHKKFDQQTFFHLISNEVSFTQLENKIFYNFIDKKYLIQSLLQSTFCYEVKPLESNERLEFIGDSIVNFIVGAELFHRYQSMEEGELSKLRGSLVNEEKLAELARFIGLGDFLFIGKGELSDQGHDKDSLLADAFEALMAALYYDGQKNIEIPRDVFLKIIVSFDEKNRISYFDKSHLEAFDPKSKLQEVTMKKFGELPHYQSIPVEGTQLFKTTLSLKGKKVAEQIGISKKKNEKKCARDALELMKD